MKKSNRTVRKMRSAWTGFAAACLAAALTMSALVSCAPQESRPVVTSDDLTPPSAAQEAIAQEAGGGKNYVPFPVSWTVKMKKKQKETQDILSYHTQAAGCSDKARAKASGGRQPIEECGRTGL